MWVGAQKVKYPGISAAVLPSIGPVILAICTKTRVKCSRMRPISYLPVNSDNVGLYKRRPEDEMERPMKCVKSFIVAVKG